MKWVNVFGNNCRRYAIIALLLLSLSSLASACIRPIEASSANGTVGSSTDSSTPRAGGEISIDIATESRNGIPVGFTVDGHPFRGKPDAPVTMYEYSDYQCPFCARYFVQTEPALNEAYIRSGIMRVVFRDFPLDSIHPNASAAAEAAQCVGVQGAALYWEMHDQLFRSQEDWSNLDDPAPIFLRLATEISADVTKYNECISFGQKKAGIAKSIEEALGLEFGGTPSFRLLNRASGEGWNLIGAQPFDQFANYIDAIAQGDAPVAARQSENNEQAGEMPFWATAEGLQPDPDRPGLTMAGDPYRGNPDANVIVVEFSDFQCPFCRRHTTTTQPALDASYVETDQILWVFKHYPLDIHPQAVPAAIAAECAADQAKFWEMHALLFADAAPWSISDPTPIFSALAKELGLDQTLFDSCLQNDETEQRVLADMNDGSAFVQGTPTFVILKDGQGRLIPGALPLEQFNAILEEVLTIGFQ